MSLSNASLLEGATVSASGGTALDLESRGSEPGRNILFVPADTDLRTRREIDCSVSYPRVQASAPNGYTQARRVAFMKFPLELDNGKVTVNTVKIEMATDVETTTSEIQAYSKLAAQVLIDADFSGFFEDLSVA